MGEEAQGALSIFAFSTLRNLQLTRVLNPSDCFVCKAESGLCTRTTWSAGIAAQSRFEQFLNMQQVSTCNNISQKAAAAVCFKAAHFRCIIPAEVQSGNVQHQTAGSSAADTSNAVWCRGCWTPFWMLASQLMTGMLWQQAETKPCACGTYSQAECGIL